MNHVFPDLRLRPKKELYAGLLSQAESVWQGERDAIANAANLSALLYRGLPDVNWAGFYFVRDGVLVLGPFQGGVACVRIEHGRGVCGTAWAESRTVLVPDVRAFPGYIACDHATHSEIVVPLRRQNCVLGVLDLDSTRPSQFDNDDAEGLAALVERYLYCSNI